MNFDNEEFLNCILSDLGELKHIPLEDLPNIDLYMDQLTTFMDNRLSSTKRYSEDKVLTKTMINNYAKNKILPSPNKKQYTTEHLITLLFIYYFKSFLSITDIQKILEPLEEKYFDNEQLNLKHIYQEVFSMEEKALQDLQEDITRKYSISRETFTDAPSKDRALLQRFAFICGLSYDVYLKKMLIEKLIDEIPDTKPDPKKQKAAKKAAKANKMNPQTGSSSASKEKPDA